VNREEKGKKKVWTFLCRKGEKRWLGKGNILNAIGERGKTGFSGREKISRLKEGIKRRGRVFSREKGKKKKKKKSSKGCAPGPGKGRRIRSCRKSRDGLGTLRKKKKRLVLRGKKTTPNRPRDGKRGE